MKAFDFSSLSTSEIGVYDVLQKNAEHITDLTIRDVAKEAHVSTATVLRCLGKMGYSTFSKFKYSVTADTQVQRAMSLSHESTYLTQICQRFFARPLKEEFATSIHTAAKWINNSKNIFLIGMGSSNLIAQYGVLLFGNYGFPAFTFDRMVPVAYFKGDFQSTVAIILSVSGNNNVDSASVFHKRGSKVISITSSESSKLSTISDLTIHYDIKEEHRPSGADVTTQVPVVFLLESIARESGELLEANKSEKSNKIDIGNKYQR